MNKKGFVLVETLVVTLFTLFTFSILYNSAVPLLGKYEELKYYDDLDTTYDLYHIRKLIRNDTNLATISNYETITCSNDIISVDQQENCFALFRILDIDPTEDEIIYLKRNYKSVLQADISISEDVRNYLDYIDVNRDIIIFQKDGYVSYLNA